ncbi:glycosyltransferase family 4 protein, partial [Vibrio mimicus]
KIYNIPVIYQCHAAQVDSFFSNEIKKRLVNKIFQQYDLRLCLGNFWKDKFEKITKLEWNVLPNPVAKFSFDKIEHDSFNLLFMGELSNRKGIKDLIQAFVLVKHENAKLYIAGNGDIKRLMELCNKLGINDRVEFLGWIDSIKKSDLLSIADVVILPSYAEGLPISVLEAMSANIAVIATPVGAVSDAITHNVNGLLVTPGKIDELADAINDLGYDKEKRQKFAELGRKKFNESFHEDIVAHKILEFYDRLTNECGVSK